MTSVAVSFDGKILVAAIQSADYAANGRAAIFKETLIKYRKRRLNIVHILRSQIFRQIVQKFRRHTRVCQGIFVQYAGKYASKMRAKALAVI